jgi:hypothetical protein
MLPVIIVSDIVEMERLLHEPSATSATPLSCPSPYREAAILLPEGSRRSVLVRQWQTT